MKLTKASIAGLILVASLGIVKAQTSPLGALPASLHGMVKESEVTIGSSQISPQINALVHDAQESNIDCKQAATFSYISPQVATQSFTTWLSSQGLKATSANEMTQGGWPVEPNPNSSSTAVYWKAQNDTVHYAGAWLGSSQGGKLLMCSGIYNYKPSDEALRYQAEHNDTTTTTHYGRGLWLFAIIVGGGIARRLSKGFSSSDLD